MTKIYNSQLGYLLLLIIPITKLMLLPAMLYESGGTTCIFSILIYMAFDLAIILIGIFIKNNFDIGIIGFIAGKLGKPLARVIAVIFSVFLLMKAFLPAIETKLFLSQTIYQSLPKIVSVIPLFLVSGYMAYKGLRAIGRNCDLLFIPATLCLVVVTALGLIAFKPSNLLPMFNVDFGAFLGSTLRHSFYFGDSIIMLFVISKMSFKNKKSYKPIVWSTVIAYALVLIFLIIFYGVFAQSSPLKTNALAKIGAFGISLNNFMRLDWIFMLPELLCSALYIAIYIYLSSALFCYAFDIKNRGLVTFIQTAALIIVSMFFINKFAALMAFYTDAFYIVCLILQYALPLLLLPLAFKREKKHYEVKTNV